MYATEWQDYPSDEQIEQHKGPWLMRIDGQPKSLEVGWFEQMLFSDAPKQWAWINDNRSISRNGSGLNAKFCPLVLARLNDVQAKCDRVRLPTLIKDGVEQIVWVRESDIHRVFEYVPNTGDDKCVVSVRTDGDEKGSYIVNASADDVAEACAIAYNAVKNNAR